MANDSDTMQFNASVNQAWDNNLFRARNREQSDQITTYSARVKIDKSYSQQRFIINLNYLDNQYQRNRFLNFDTFNYDATWRWTLTPELTGVLSSNKYKTLTGFSDFRNLVQNIATNEINQVRAEYSPHQTWFMIAGFTDFNSINSAPFNEIPAFNSKAFDYGARYNFTSGASMTFLGHQRTGNFDRSVIPAGLFDNSFTEDEYEWDTVLRATGKINFSSKLAYLSRKYDNFSVRDYDAWFGFIRYDATLTGKLNLNSELSRVIGQFDTSYSSYFATDSLTASLNYVHSDKLTAGINARFAQRDFKQEVVAGLPSRTDNEKSLGASVTWQPIRNFGLIVNSTRSSRNASNGYNNFDFNDVTTSVTLDFKI